nr:hypothetical protein [Kyrpidia tusciae]
MSNRGPLGPPEGRPGGTESQENEWGPGTWRLLEDEAESLLETHRQVMDSYRSGTIDHLNGRGGKSSGEQTPAEDDDRFSEQSS